MLTIEEKKENLIALVRSMPEEKLDLLEQLLSTIDLFKKDSVELLFTEAAAQYGNTLKKLAE